MRVIEKTLLALRDGTSDKVFEIDLVEVATGQYVVNFRHGRRGTVLAEGTKTPSPVTGAKARLIIEKLVGEKQAGGYRVQGSVADADADEDEDDEDEAPTNGSRDAVAAILERLAEGIAGETPIGPAVWAAADRDLKAAEPHLRALIDKATPEGIARPAWEHNLIGAFVRCGTAASLDALERVANDMHRPSHVRDVARLAIARIAPERADKLVRPYLTPSIVAALQGDAAGLANAAETVLQGHAVTGKEVAAGLYCLHVAGHPIARPAIMAMARVARLSVGTEAAAVRALYRLAELARDPEVFALLARRIDDHTGYRPFGENTRRYFRRRVARVLRRLGRAGSPDYVAMAAGVLRTYSDADAQAPRMRRFDAFARYHALNDMLFAKGPRYRRIHHGRSVWQTQGGYQPGGDPPKEREERWPGLWDAAPTVVWDLVAHSQATPVQEFATRALRANAAFVGALSDDALVETLAGGHRLAQRFAYDIVKTRPLTAKLARAALASAIPEAHTWVLMWISANAAAAVADPELVALLVTGPTTSVRDAATHLLATHAIDPAVARSAAARAVAILLGLPGDANERGAGAVATLLAALAAPLRDIGADVLRDLLRHPLAALGVLAGELMLRHAQRDDLPHDLLESLLAHPAPQARALAAQLIALTPPDVAKDDLDVLELFALSGNRELREGTRPLLAAIARDYPDVARALADRLVDALLTKQEDGVPSHVVALLRGELAHTLPHKSAATILKLAGALSPHAREAAGLLLAGVDPDEIGLEDIARLAGNEILAIREGAWSLARRSLARYRLAPVAVSRLVDSAWQDTRGFAMALIRDELGGALTADAIVAICDSVRPEVQAFGKALLQERFTEADAGTYLVRLAEHPSTNLQLLVSGLLEHHVGGDLARLEKVTPFLTTVLCQVNRGGVAKQRVMQLVRREATRSESHARLLAPLLDRQSAAIAVTQKHPLIATMVEVRTAHPEVALPIAVVPPAPHPRRTNEGGL